MVRDTSKLKGSAMRRLSNILAALSVVAMIASGGGACAQTQNVPTAGTYYAGPATPIICVNPATGAIATCVGANGQNLPSGLPSWRVVAGGYTAYATPTDLVCINASPTKETIVSSGVLQIQSTSATLGLLDWVKRSAQDTGGTPTTLTLLPEDTQYPGGTPAVGTTVVEYGSAPTLGSTVGVFTTDPVLTGTLTAVPGVFSLFATIGLVSTVTNFQGAIVLHPGEALCANWRGNAIPSGFTAIVNVQVEEYANQ